jgi:signal transduction histidine kinase
MIEEIFNINNYFLNPYALPYYLVGILTLCEGIFIFIQNRKSLINLSYALSCVAVMLWLVGVGAIYSTTREAVSVFWGKYLSFLGIIFITPTIYFFSVCWQQPLLSGQEFKKKLSGVVFNFVCALILYFFCTGSDLFISGAWRYPWGYYPKAGPAYLLLMGWFFVLMVLAIMNFAYVSRREEAAVKKKQAGLMIAAFSIAFVGSLEFLPNYGVALYLFAFIPVLTCITIVGYSIIRYRLMDIETVIHKSIAWFLTNLILIVPFAALFYLTRHWYIGLNKAAAFSFLAALLLSFLFFFRILQPKMDRFFRRERFNLEGIASRFTEDLVHLKGFDMLIQRIEETISDALYTQGIGIYILDQESKVYRLANVINKSQAIAGVRGEDRFLQWLAENNKIAYREFVDIDPGYAQVRKEAAAYFNLTDAIVVIPLVLNEKLLGVINLGKKANLRRYSAVDFDFLATLKNQSTIAISNSLLFENMEGQVRQRTKELVEMQKQLIQAEKLASVGTLAGGVAHEINNPLTAILTNVQMLLGDTQDNHLDRESLELIEEATKRCRTIVKKLMAYAKKPLDTAAVTRVDLSDVLKGVMSFIGYQLEQENIKIVVTGKENTYFVMGNQNELEQVITNIVLNARDAIKHLKNSGEIHIGLSEDEGQVKVSIRDEGIGIPADKISKIFDPFFTTKDVGKGTGLGLSICQSIVEKLNGRITVQSQPNKGSVFTVQLPKK